MRIVGGKFKGLSLNQPSGRNTRPTTDRVREAIFNILQHGIDDFSFENKRVLDLFAGTGALGLEALSRGAKFVQFVEQSHEARGLIRRNADQLGVIGQVKVWQRDATKLGKCEPQPPFDLVFLDPPYGKGIADHALAALCSGNWLAANCVVVVEELQDAIVTIPEQLQILNQRTYGKTQIIFAIS